MKRLLTSLLLFQFLFCNAQDKIDQLPILKDNSGLSTDADWLVKNVNVRAGVYRSQDSKEIILYNGLLKRSFRINQNAACVDFVNLSNGEQMLRAVKPEAILTINGKPVNVEGFTVKDKTLTC